MLLYRGLSKTRADAIVGGAEQIAATSNGEFGNGSYYWRDDLPAGIISALQYYGQAAGGWAVISISVSQLAVQQQGITAPAMMSFRPNANRPSDYGTGYDAGTDTTIRSVTVPQFGDASVRMNFNEFREINADPEGHGLTGEKNTLTWGNYAIIAGPTVACPTDATLTQIKFQGQGLALLNAAPKALVIHGPALNDITYQRVRSWSLEDRKRIYEDRFAGRAEVNLAL
ncbi:hypothetical protein [Roseomonas sp. HF4]|uniref:hypothetical protein n=1 Tax=Roseomonas sp. HF4 TaxID=2562313 RepID=UPI0010BFE872|nr:hypothetical protein [Roseomonas sp. HF4]